MAGAKRCVIASCGRPTVRNLRRLDANRLADLTEPRNVSQLDDLDKYAQIMVRMSQAQERTRHRLQRCASRAYDDVNEGGDKMPTIVITSEPANTRRMGLWLLCGGTKYWWGGGGGRGKTAPYRY